MRTSHKLLLLFMFTLFLVAGLTAQDKGSALSQGIKATYAASAAQAENELVSLAGAIPQEKFTWRPAEGVRSISESFLHAALGNYITLTTMGGKLAEGVDTKTLEKSTTDKAKIVDALKKSFAAVNEYVANLPESDYAKQVKFFGMDRTVLDMVVLANTHAHETLGQAIAYARMNGVVPPWTAAMQAREKEGMKK
jgi:uncharacterized damage-inducible protein DinB